MTADIIALPGQHPQDCEVCGGKRRVRVAELRYRAGQLVPAWVGSREMPCPLSSAADGLRALLAGADGPRGAA